MCVKAGYLPEEARCQACGYLHETRLTCPTAIDPRNFVFFKWRRKISLTREELVELLKPGGCQQDMSDILQLVVSLLLCLECQLRTS
jgi:hypothetical protein